jgi:hypothetical protein
LFGRYFDEIAAFNSSKDDPPPGYDGEMQWYEAQPFNRTAEQMIGVPVRNDRDALAAIDMLLHCGDGCVIDFSNGERYDRVAASLIHAVRDFLAGRIA